MTRSYRLSILLVAAILGAGCGTGSPATSGAAGASPTPTPKPTPFPIPTPRYTMPPAGSRCPSLNSLYHAPEAALNFVNARGFASPPTVAVGRAPLLVPFRPVIPGDRGDGVGVLLGGREQGLEAFVGYEVNEYLHDSARLTSVELTLELPDHAPIRLRTMAPPASGDTLEVRFSGVPDTDAEGVLHLRIAWADRCYEYVAEGPMGVRVASQATVAGCAPDANAARRQLEALFGAGLAFGGGSARLAAVTATGFLVDLPIIDGPYPAMMFDRNAPVATAGTHDAVSFHASNPALTLVVGERPTVRFYARDAVIRHIDAGGYYGGDPIPAILFETEFLVTDGRFELRAPAKPGRYVVGVDVSFRSECYVGSAVAAPGLDVVAD